MKRLLTFTITTLLFQSSFSQDDWSTTDFHGELKGMKFTAQIDYKIDCAATTPFVRATLHSVEVYDFVQDGKSYKYDIEGCKFPIKVDKGFLELEAELYLSLTRQFNGTTSSNFGLNKAHLSLSNGGEGAAITADEFRFSTESDVYAFFKTTNCFGLNKEMEQGGIYKVLTITRAVIPKFEGDFVVKNQSLNQYLISLINAQKSISMKGQGLGNDNSSNNIAKQEAQNAMQEYEANQRIEQNKQNNNYQEYSSDPVIETYNQIEKEIGNLIAARDQRIRAESEQERREIDEEIRLEEKQLDEENARMERANRSYQKYEYYFQGIKRINEYLLEEKNTKNVSVKTVVPVLWAVNDTRHAFQENYNDRTNNAPDHLKPSINIIILPEIDWLSYVSKWDVTSKIREDFSSKYRVAFVDVENQLFRSELEKQVENNQVENNMHIVEYDRSYASYVQKLSQSRKDFVQSQFKNPQILKEIKHSMVLVSGGVYSGKDNNKSQVVYPFKIGKYEVTQEQWNCVMGDILPYMESLGNKLPVFYINPKYLELFIHRLNEMTGAQFRLPTELEWEYAANGGETSFQTTFSGSNNAEEVAWVNQTGKAQLIHDVGLKKPNKIGTYDMSGNIDEFVRANNENKLLIKGGNFGEPRPIYWSSEIVANSTLYTGFRLVLIDDEVSFKKANAIYTVDAFEEHLRMYPNTKFKNETLAYLQKINTGGSVTKLNNEIKEKKTEKQNIIDYLENEKKRKAELKGKIEIARKEALSKDGKFENGLLRIKIDGKYGYIDESNSLRVPCVYSWVSQYNKDTIHVEKKIGEKKLMGYVNSAGGDIIIPIVYKGLGYFHNNYAYARGNEKSGFINNKGDTVLAFKYDEIKQHQEGTYCVKLNGQYGYLDSTLSVIINPVYDDANSFSEGYAAVKKDGRFGFIDKSGKVVIPFQFIDGDEFSEGICTVKTSNQTDNYGSINKNGELIINGGYYFLGTLKENLMPFWDKKGWGYLNRNGGVEFRTKYTELSSYFQGKAWAFDKVRNEWIKIDKSGKCIDNCQ